ncbi:hypothetical protein ASPCADRAFT_143710 [Aspergillus carbonarius ITEM 5010]|uniref:Uncharacterized protein n=1 Tax=Aspergillus carbonarius (strain ITEM 5010) TaxID=602072 RepID=A0A1R3RS63_ASPC5|nr:hypothetical protein ASPCADRAFT_143710 [Aspergillus carbonarius ITEM 5010]
MDGWMGYPLDRERLSHKANGFGSAAASTFLGPLALILRSGFWFCCWWWLFTPWLVVNLLRWWEYRSMMMVMMMMMMTGICVYSFALISHARLLKDFYYVPREDSMPSNYQTPSVLLFHGERVHGRRATYTFYTL